MVQTHNSENNNPPDPISTQLAIIATKLEAFETMKEDIAALKEGERFRSSGNGEGHRCKTGTLKVLEAEEDMEEPPVTQFFNPDSDQEETAEISLHAILAKPNPTTMKVR
nr:retrotransposon Gag domain, retroviral aspartyl protease [Tanacetum cinerariifolium]